MLGTAWSLLGDKLGSAAILANADMLESVPTQVLALEVEVRAEYNVPTEPVGLWELGGSGLLSGVPRDRAMSIWMCRVML